MASRPNNRRNIQHIKIQDITGYESRPVVESVVSYLKESIPAIGMIQPIIVARKGDHVVLVAGRNRIETCKQLGHKTIRCLILEEDDPRVIELVEIEENFARRDMSAAEEAKAAHRRAELLKDFAREAGTLSRDATASRQSDRRRGVKTGGEPSSIRTHATVTGQSKDKVFRGRKLAKQLGIPLLDIIKGSSLDTPKELKALCSLPEERRQELAGRAAKGEQVTATTLHGTPKPRAAASSKRNDRDKAAAEFRA